MLYSFIKNSRSQLDSRFIRQVSLTQVLNISDFRKKVFEKKKNKKIKEEFCGRERNFLLVFTRRH